MKPEDLGAIIDRYAGPLVLYARQWCATPEDVVQDAFIKLAQQSVAPKATGAWLYKVVRHRAISAYRSASRRQAREAATAQERPSWFNPAAESTSIDSNDVTKALGQIPDDEREVIVAHIWGNLTFEEIAEIADSSSATVWRRFQRGLVALRERLGIECLPNTNPTTKR